MAGGPVLRYNRRMPLEDELGDIVAKARAGRNMSARQLAAATGLSEREITEIESYRLKPQDETIQHLADSLGLDARKLADIAHSSWQPRPGAEIPRSFVLTRVLAPFGAYAENAYVIGCAETARSAVVDPGGAVDKIEQHLLTHQLELCLILITHAHADHIGVLRQLAGAHPDVTITCSEVDRGSVMRGVHADWRPAEDGSETALGKLTVTTLATPGHTAGSVCYALDGVCFVGDTLFAGSIGRPTCDYQAMLDAIRSKILSLPDETVLLPGHGPATTVGEEKAHNPFF